MADTVSLARAVSDPLRRVMCTSLPARYLMGRRRRLLRERPGYRNIYISLFMTRRQVEPGPIGLKTRTRHVLDVPFHMASWFPALKLSSFRALMLKISAGRFIGNRRAQERNHEIQCS